MYADNHFTGDYHHNHKKGCPSREMSPIFFPSRKLQQGVLPVYSGKYPYNQQQLSPEEITPRNVTQLKIIVSR
jgi:hypothetical protein